MRLSVTEREFFRERCMIPQFKKNEIVSQFVKEGIARSTVYKTINRLETDPSITNNKKTGRPLKLTTANRLNLKRLTNNRFGVSQRKLGNKFSVNQSTISRNLSKLGIKYRKRQKAPYYTERQMEKSKYLCAKLANKLHRNSVSVIMDDEKYFTLRGNNIPRNDGYYSKNKATCPDNVRFSGNEKFPKKILVWFGLPFQNVEYLSLLFALLSQKQ